jgi:metal-responsive CopG/Arc/MetJ family transcriptional regulator
MRYMVSMQHSLTIRLDDHLMRKLEAESRRTRTSKGELVRNALREQLRPARPSVLEALGDLVGIMEGPPDLSTNKKYLADFGRRRRRA